jgi:putative ABC transport system permease protein
MEEKGQFLGFDLDDGIYIPTQKAQLIFNQEGVLEIDVVFDPELTTSNETRNRIKKLMIQLHGREDFTLLTQEDMIASLDKILSIMKVVIGSLGGIALIVGGVGVFTIMTTSMKERTQEIGLLTALGTTKKLILTLFLGEAICLSTLGGALGLGVVVSAISVMKLFVPGLPLILNPVFLLFALSVSSVIGLFAGIYPAHLASNLNPIDALRAE